MIEGHGGSEATFFCKNSGKTTRGFERRSHPVCGGFHSSHLCCVQTDGRTLGSSPGAAVMNDYGCPGLAQPKRVTAQFRGPEAPPSVLPGRHRGGRGAAPLSERWERLHLLAISQLLKAPPLDSGSSSTFRSAVTSL